MNNIKYRRSIKEDIPEINNLFIEMVETVNERMKNNGINPYEGFENGFEENYLDSFYVDDSKIIYVAVDDNKVIGFISIVNKKESNYIYLDDYCVNKEYRGKGIGSTLMNMSFDFAEEQGIDEIITHVESANKESIKFYENKGFKLVEKQGHRLLIRKIRGKDER